MSSEAPVISVEALTKSFRIDDSGHASAWHGLGRDRARPFIAVDDVSFNIHRGELVGLVGANGAGKSTLLKLMSRVMHPDKGRIVLGGPVMSLLEVGAGFHPELTARENVYLNGAILGLSKQAVQRKFDGIVSLAGVARFLDTPVKRFSSGMKVRLAVAVGLHLDSDLTILDEVLAVGDAEFQRRCLETLDAMAAGGDRATMLVSHNMATIQQVCQRVLVMQKGRLIFDGDPQDAIAEYFQQVAGGAPQAGSMVSARTNAYGPLVLRDVRLHDGVGHATAPVVGGSLGVSLDLDLSGVGSQVRVALRFQTRDRQLIAVAERDLDSMNSGGTAPLTTAEVVLEVMPFAAGQYTLSVTIAGENGNVLDVVEQVLTFTVTDVTKPAGSLAAGLSVPHVLLEGDWTAGPLASPTEEPT